MLPLSKAILSGLLAGVLGLVVSLVPFGLALEESVGLEVLFQLRGVRQPPSDVVIVSIDRASAARLDVPDNPRKWPRSLHARLMENLTQAGVAAIAFDIIFDESRSAADDQAFAEAIRQARQVVLFASLKRETVSFTGEGGAVAGALHMETLVPPLPPLVQAAAAFAPFPLPKIPVKVSQYWTFKTGAGGIPTLPVVMLQVFALEAYDDFLRLVEKVSPSQAAQLPRDKEAILTTTGVVSLVRVLRDIFVHEPLTAESMLGALQHASPFSVDVKKRQLLTSLIRMYQNTNSQYLNFYGPPGTVTTVPYYQVLQLQEKSTEDQKQLDLYGKAVFVGFSERLRPAQKDGFYTVFSQANGVDISGVEIAATAFANLLEDMPIRPLAVHAQLIMIFLWGLVLGVGCRLLPTVIAAVSALGLGALYLIAVQQQFMTVGSWYPLIIPVCFQMPLAFFGTVLWKYFDTSKERHNIRKALGYYLPNQVIEQLSKNVADARTNNQLVYGTCLFTDAGQYTSLAETMEPAALGSFMNQYFEVIFEPVQRHGGSVSDVVGDSVLAIWATLQPDATPRHQACLAALAISSAVQRFKQAANTLHLQTRIGLHSGPILLGPIGALGHYEYRAIGDIVNAASRIENLNKYLGTGILVSQEVLHQLDGFVTRELGAFQLVGKSKPLVVHELLCRVEESHWYQRNLCVRFAEALGAYRKQSWNEALEKFYAIISSSDTQEDGPSLFYIELCEQYRINPPGASWNGVVRMMRK